MAGGGVGAVGFLALELDTATGDPATLPEAELIDAIAGFEKLISWAGVRQSVLLAEFARRRRAEDREAGISQRLQSTSRWAPDEIGLALSRTRMTAIADWGRRCSCVTCCPQRWRRGRRAGWMR